MVPAVFACLCDGRVVRGGGDVGEVPGRQPLMLIRQRVRLFVAVVACVGAHLQDADGRAVRELGGDGSGDGVEAADDILYGEVAGR